MVKVLKINVVLCIIFLKFECCVNYLKVLKYVRNLSDFFIWCLKRM